MLYQELPFYIRVQQNCQNAEILPKCKSTQAVLCDEIINYSFVATTVFIVTIVNLMRIRSEISCAVVSTASLPSLSYSYPMKRNAILVWNTCCDQEAHARKLLLSFALWSPRIHHVHSCTQNDTKQKHDYLNWAGRVVISRLIIESRSFGVSPGLSLLWSELDPLVETEDGHVAWGRQNN